MSDSELLGRRSSRMETDEGEYGSEMMHDSDTADDNDMDYDFGGSDVQEERIEGDVCDSIGTKTIWFPNCDDGMKPVVGKRFSTVDEGIKCYKNYAVAVGFVVCLSTSRKAKDKTVLRKYLVCNKAGFQASSNSSGKRNRLTTRIGCMARDVLKFVGKSGYVVNEFEERHSHCMVDECSRQFMKSNRKLDI